VHRLGRDSRDADTAVPRSVGVLAKSRKGLGLRNEDARGGDRCRSESGLRLLLARTRDAAHYDLF
jgi:hypothetical protein